MECYIEVKEGITRNQTEDDACVLNYEDPVLREFGETLKTQGALFFSSKQTLETKASTWTVMTIVYRHDGKNEKVIAMSTS